MAIDPGGRLAGRGAYVCRSTGCLERALGKGALARALRSQIPAEVRATLASTAAHDELTETNETERIEGGARGQE